MKKEIKANLAPCPFCGGDPEIRQFANPKNFYSIQCPDCRCGTDAVSYTHLTLPTKA